MKMAREALLAALETVRPAIAKNDTVNQFAHAWFSGTHVTAFDDSTRLGIRIAFKSELKAGVRGAMLLSLLSNSRVEEVEIELVDDFSVKLKAGGSRAEINTLPPEQELWHFPKTKEGFAFTVDASFIAALNKVDIAFGKDESMLVQLGVSLIATKNELHLFTTDADVLAHAIVDKPANYGIAAKEKLILPATFIAQLIKLGEGTSLAVFKDYVIATHGGVSVYSTSLVDDRKIDFFDILERHKPDSADTPVSVPERLALALDRICIFATDGEPTTVTLGGGAVKFSVSSKKFGDLVERIKLEDEHPDIEVSVRPDLIKRGLPFCDKLSIGAQALLFTGKDDFTYMVSTL